MVDMYAMSSLPTPIEGQLENRNVVKVSAGHSHSACITDKGELFVWGMSVYLEPTMVTSITRVSVFDRLNFQPTCLDGVSRLFPFLLSHSSYLFHPLIHCIFSFQCVDVACGENYTVVLTDDGLIYSFGKGKDGVLGHGNTSNLYDPTLVVTMADKTVLRMNAGLSHFACMATERTSEGNPELIKRSI